MAVVGIQTLVKVDFDNLNNTVIVGTSIGLSMLATAQPHIADHFPAWMQVIFGSGITLGAMSAIVLHLVFNFGNLCSTEQSVEQDTVILETPVWNVVGMQDKPHVGGEPAGHTPTH